MAMPKISIIVPIYNVENYLNFCVDSLKRQTYADFEILLIDDGSTDSSGRICDKLKKTDERIVVYHKENGGLSDARNFGIKHSKGDFFLFIDSDDALHPDFCKVLIETQQKYNADIVSVKMTLFSDCKMISELDKKPYKYEEKIFYDEEILSEYFEPKGSRCIYHGLCMKLYKKELFKNLQFEVGRRHEDLYITHRLLNLVHCFVFVDLPYYYYFQNNNNSICTNYELKNFIDEYDAISLMLAAYENKSKIESHLKKFVAEHYLYLINRYYSSIKNKKELKKKKNELAGWVKNYISSNKELPQKYKIKKYIRLCFPRIYSLLISIKNKRLVRLERTEGVWL